MSALRWFTDEDVYAAIAPALRRAGIDAVSAREEGRLGESDESQLGFAAEGDRTILSFNVAHFAKLHGLWLQQGRFHAGIVLSKQRRIGELLPRLHRLTQSIDAAQMRNRLEFLADW